MKTFIDIALIAIISVNSYNRDNAVAYAKKHWNNPNHNCSGAYTTCSPYSYWGGEHCGYGSHGGDCANFVSQCLIAGGHPALTKGACRGYPCGKEEVGARNLGVCLRDSYGWESSCGYQKKPPSNIAKGDVLIYHSGSCDSYDAHAVIVISGASNAVNLSDGLDGLASGLLIVAFSFFGAIAYYSGLHNAPEKP